MASTYSGIIKRDELNRFGGKSGRDDSAKVNLIARRGFQTAWPGSSRAARDVRGGNTRSEAILKRSLRNHQLLLTLRHQYIIEDGDPLLLKDRMGGAGVILTHYYPN